MVEGQRRQISFHTLIPDSFIQDDAVSEAGKGHQRVARMVRQERNEKNTTVRQQAVKGNTNVRKRMQTFGLEKKTSKITISRNVRHTENQKGSGRRLTEKGVRVFAVNETHLSRPFSFLSSFPLLVLSVFPSPSCCLSLTPFPVFVRCDEKNGFEIE
jgi:hypothetical protein